MKRFWSCMIAASLLVASVVHAAEPRPLTETEVVATAAHQAPALLAASREAEAAEHAYVAAQRARLPDVALTGRYTRLSSLPERYRTLAAPTPVGDFKFVLPQLLDNLQARAALIVPLSDAWLGLASAARAQGLVADAKRLEREATQARVAYEARVAFLLYRRASAARDIARTAHEITAAQVTDHRAKVDAGLATPATLLMFENAANAAHAQLRSAEAAVIAAEAQVRSFLPQASASQPLILDSNHSQPAPDNAAPAALRAVLRATEAADRQVTARTQAMLPSLVLVAGADVNAPSPRAFAMDRLVAIPTWDITVQLSWSLSKATVGSAERAQARAEREAWRARAEELRRQLHAQRLAAGAQRQSADARLRASEESVRTAESLAESRRQELQAGVATPLDVTNAEGDRVRAALERTDAAIELQLAQAQLDYVNGWIPAPPRAR